MPDILLQVLPAALSQSYQDGFTQVEGYAVRAADVAFASSPAALIEAFGYGAVAQAYSPERGYVDALRFPVAALQRVETAYGSNDAAEAARMNAAIVDKPPFTGTGFTASRAAVVPQWRLGRTRIPPGTELLRFSPDRVQQLSTFRDVGYGWSGDDGAAVPSHLIGMRADYRGAEYLADLIDGGDRVVLAGIGEHAAAGFEQVRRYVHRRVVDRAEVAELSEVVMSCTWRDNPFEITASWNAECRLTYTGRNSYAADRLGLQITQPGVYEITVPRAELRDVSGIVRQFADPDS